MSPIGDSLRVRCRKFPALVNCCTINWFFSWPEDALITVATALLENYDKIPVYDNLTKRSEVI
jgi:dynein heavy chain